MQHGPLRRVKRRQIRHAAAQCVFPKAAVDAGSNGPDRHRSFAARLFDVSVANEPAACRRCTI